MENILLFMPSGPELIIIVVIILLLFGGKKIPELMRGLGRGVKEFKNASDGIGEVKDEINKSSSAVEDKYVRDENAGNETKGETHNYEKDEKK
jgi:sec-independent protein translocase protein TatA